MATPTPVVIPGLGGTTPPSRRTHYNVSWATHDLGLSDDVDPTAFKMELEAIMTFATGSKLKLGDRVVGAGGTIKVTCRQVNLALYEVLCPWPAANGSTGLALLPPLNVDLYQYAQPLVLHPQDLGTATSEDVTFFKAVPITSPGLLKKSGKEDAQVIEFAVYPDRAKLAADGNAITSIGQVGP